MFKAPFRFVVTLFLVLTPLVAAAGDVEEIDGVRYIRNGAEPADGARTLHLEEAWRINIEDEEHLIGVVSAVLTGPDGTVWMADQQLGQVFVYSAGGEYLRTLSRQGEGPGEIYSPRGLLWLSGGGLGIVDRKQGQITTLDLEGLPLSSIRLQNGDGEPMASAQLSLAQCCGGTLALCGTQFRFDDGPPTQSRFFSIFDTGGREVKRLMDAPSGFDYGARTYDELANYFVDRGAWAIDDRGRVHHAPHYNRYLIEVHDAEGQLVQVIEREFEVKRRTAEEKEQIRVNTTMSVNGETVQLDCDLQDCHPAIDGIEAAVDGGIWVQNGRDNHNLPEGIVRTYDVFDAEGHFREVVHLAGDLDRNMDRLYRLADGRWLLLRNITAARRAMNAAFHGGADAVDEDEDAEPLEIVCLRAESE